MQGTMGFFTFIVCDYQGLLLINPRNIISNIIMIFNINSTRGQTRFLACVARVTCLVSCKSRRLVLEQNKLPFIGSLEIDAAFSGIQIQWE